MESYRFIDGYEDYMVSDKGAVISLKFGKTRLIKQQDNGKGYIGVRLTINGKTKRYLTHRLVAKAFIKNPLDKEEVNHIDENKSNNSMDNLEWTTHQENIDHSAGIRVSDRQIIQRNSNREIIAVWGSVLNASTCGFSSSAISFCIKNPDSTYKDFYWSVLYSENTLNNQHFLDMRKAELFANLP